MAEAHSSQLWDHTATMLAALINIPRAIFGKELVKPEQLHPFRKPAQRGFYVPTPEESKEGFAAMKRFIASQG